MLREITSEMIARINELAKKKRDGSISESELAEQAALRRAYIDVIKDRVKTQLDAVSIEDHQEDCRCGHHH